MTEPKFIIGPALPRDLIKKLRAAIMYGNLRVAMRYVEELTIAMHNFAVAEQTTEKN
jgi:hypothetical protein